MIEAVGSVWRASIDQALSSAAILAVCALFALWRPYRCFLAGTLSFIATELIFQRLSWLTGGVEQPWLIVILSLVLSARCALCSAVLDSIYESYVAGHIGWDEAAHQIGDIYRNGEHIDVNGTPRREDDISYGGYYGKWRDASHPAPSPSPSIGGGSGSSGGHFQEQER